MRFAIVWGLSLALAVPLLGAPPLGADPETGADPLDRLLDGMARSAGFEAQFDEALEMALLRNPVRSRGSLYFVPPNRMARFTRSPVATALLLDGERIEYRDADGERIDLSGTAMARVFASNLVLLFSGDREALEANYNVVFEEQHEDWQLSLVPRKAPLNRALKRIALSGRGPRLDTMDVLDSEDTRTTTTFDAVRTDRGFKAAELATLFEHGQPLPAPKSASSP